MLGATAFSSPSDAELLIHSVQELSRVHDLDGIMAVVRRRARELTGADGVSFVVREHDHVFYADENAIAPLWKGRRFPMSACVSGWAMLHRRPAVIEDIYADERVPVAAYQPTFVKSLMIVPIREEDPVGAIGAYWARRHLATEREQTLLQALANSTAIAIANAEMYRELKGAVRTRDQFFSVAAHELRTPLTALQLQLQAARRELDGAPLARVDAAARVAARLGKLIDDMLDASALSAPRIDLGFHVEEVDLAETVRQVVARFREPRLACGSPLDVDVDGPVVGRWDATRVDQIVANLVSNACKYGGGKPVTVRARADGDRAVLVVRDHGMGIAPDDAARVFAPFERAVSTDHYGGLGLGLFIVKTVVAAMGGSVDLDSHPGRGSTFTVVLPR